MHGFTSYFADRGAAEKAVRLCLPTIDAAMASREAGASGFLYIVVMRPGISAADCSFTDAVLYEHAVGDTSQWDADYGAFARAKAELSWRTGLDSHMVRQCKPHLLADGDSLLSGGVVSDGIVVAVSGADPWYDEAFAACVAGFLRALTKKGVSALSGKPQVGPA